MTLRDIVYGAHSWQTIAELSGHQLTKRDTPNELYRYNLHGIWEPIFESVAKHTKRFQADLVYDITALGALFAKQTDDDGPILFVLGIRECGVDSQGALLLRCNNGDIQEFKEMFAVVFDGGISQTIRLLRCATPTNIARKRTRRKQNSWESYLLRLRDWTEQVAKSEPCDPPGFRPLAAQESAQCR